MNDLLETIFRFDAAGRPTDILRHLFEQRGSTGVPHEIYQLLLQSRFLEAYVLAELFRGLGVGHPVLMFARAVGGFLFANPVNEIEGTAALSAAVGTLAEAQQAIIGTGVVHPVISQIVTSDASIVHDHDRALRILEIYKAGLPTIRAIFDWTGEVAPLTGADLQRQGRERARLISFSGPPAGAPRKPLRAIVAMRRLVFPGKADSRLFEMGLRMESAMNAYGWRASYFPLEFQHQLDFPGLLDVCVREQADLLFLDDYPVLAPATHADRAAMIAALRQKLPGLKIVAIHLDPWAIDEGVLVDTGANIDAIWAHFPANPAWKHPTLASKIVTVPFPHAGNFGEPVTPLASQIIFSGGVFGYNWHRAMWLAGVRYGLPLALQMSTHTADGIPILESYADYLRRIEQSACALNFSMRPNLSRIITGRSFETPLAGALLIQEDTPDMDYYFVAGEHYLNFSTVPELKAIARFITERPQEAEAIRRAGNSFARERYSDERLIGYLDRHLHYPA